jgi:hypothetical protein
MLNLPSVALRSAFAKISDVPYKLSNDFGKLETRRQLRVGCDWAMAGAAKVAPPTPVAIDAFFRNDLRSMNIPLVPILIYLP